MNILEEIVANKRIEVEEQKKIKPVSVLEKLPLFSTASFSIKRFLLEPNRSGIIAEFKRKSPSKGVINHHPNLTLITTAYAGNGAAGLSILTDNKFFGGSIDDIISARFNAVPILRKDFIIDEYQVIETKAIGADVILLIAAILTPKEIKELTMVAHSLGLEVILEVHNEEELDSIPERMDVIGINNRDLKTFEVNLDTSVRLSSLIPAEKLKISESGIHNIKDLIYLRQFGFNGFLIGENFMKEEDPGLAFMKFVSELNNTLV
ncbi:MAG: indole-3-glycerol phosphate synthase TrpC [Bacteroidota bacterium]|jgi:indole-3-glycerol phosphate synthase|nr:indole-3-glycerol phosphate synthase TrpC [Bacteroidota bacterium]